MNNDTITDNIKRKTGIDDFTSVSNKQFKDIQVLAGKGKITKEEMQLLVEMMPNFVKLQETYIDGLKTIINSVKETQKDALRGITITIESLTSLLHNIVDKSETEELRSKIADISLKLADHGLKVAKILQETNKENNSLWKILGSVAVVGLVVVSTVFINNKKES